MIINEQEYRMLSEISDITKTDYNINESTLPKYYISNNALLNVIYDLKQEYEHVLEQLEEEREKANERKTSYIFKRE